MDLTCPSYVADDTSDYDSKDNSESEKTIGGLCMLETPLGTLIIVWIINFILIQRKP